jgi:hypothetical protein
MNVDTYLPIYRTSHSIRMQSFCLILCANLIIVYFNRFVFLITLRLSWQNPDNLSANVRSWARSWTNIIYLSSFQSVSLRFVMSSHIILDLLNDHSPVGSRSKILHSSLCCCILATYASQQNVLIVLRGIHKLLSLSLCNSLIFLHNAFC